MTAYNMAYEGMANSRESAVLTAVAEAVTWKHASELDGPRQGQRVVIYPKELSQLEQVLSTGDPNIDSEDGHPIAYMAILQADQSFEKRPVFLKEDHEEITGDPVWSEEVPKWMNTASKVATGSRRRVLENGPDVMRSNEEDALKDEHGEELTGVYAPGCTSLDQARMTQEQATLARSQTPGKVPPRSRTPVSGSSDDDDPNGAEMVWSQTKGCMRKNKHFRGATTDGTKTTTLTPVSVPMSVPEAVPDPQPKPKKPATKAAAPQKAPAVQKPAPEAKASKPRKGQESPGTKVPKPIQTRQAASTAGGLRSGGGSGQTDTCVAQGNPSKT
jgi:hypothetical protein